MSMEINRDYRALVDIGSNGIRFSISDLSPDTARLMPIIFQDRAGISLYDAQYLTGRIAPIPSSVIEETSAALLRFKGICQDFGVHDGSVKVVATEATRNAINRDALLSRIREQTGWSVDLLSKEEEGRLGAMGMASSLRSVNGICVDLGGGSVQLTWVVNNFEGQDQMGPSISFPYGAAALMARLRHATTFGKEEIGRDLASKLRSAFEKELHIPSSQWDMACEGSGFNLYLSGGGCRGWGYVLMSQATTQPYPIPIINGYSVTESHFYSAVDLENVSASDFRISSRRASQIPAIQAIVRAIRQTGLPISQVTFTQGGVREGLLYADLPLSVRLQDPLSISTSPYGPQSAPEVTKLLRTGIPCFLESGLIVTIANLLHIHAPLPKDIRAAAALRCTTTGILAGAHGLSHSDRTLVALALCERWGGEISACDATFLDSLESLCGPMCWWMRFLGRMAKGIASIIPAGVCPNGERRVRLDSGFWEGTDALSANRCWVTFSVFRNDINNTVKAWANDMEKLGKKKHWVNGRGGLKVDVKVISADDDF